MVIKKDVTSSDIFLLFASKMGGVKGIVWRYGYQTVQDFYKSYHASASANKIYQSKLKRWEVAYGISEKPKEETLSEQIVRYQKERVEQHCKIEVPKKDKGAR